MNTLEHLMNLKPGKASPPRPQPARSKACKAAEPTLLQCGVQVVRDLFVPGHQGAKARVHSQYQLAKKLGVHQAVDGQTLSQDALSQTGRALAQVRSSVSHQVHRASAGTQEALTVAKDYWRDEARTAQGPYRAW